MRELADAYGHLRRGDRPELPREARDADGGASRRRRSRSSCWSVAAARIVLGPDVHVQAPPNLAYDDFPLLLDAGIDDWGGVSPVTVDHVNPEAPWPDVERLREATASRGLELAPRLPHLPGVRRRPGRGGPTRRSSRRAARRADARRARARGPLGARASRSPVPFVVAPGRRAPTALAGEELGEDELARLFAARGPELERVLAAADELRREVSGDDGDLRRHAQHQVHERLLLPLRLLRVLERQAREEPPRPAVPRARTTRSSRRVARGLGARRHGGLPPGRHPPALHGRLLPEVVPRVKRRGARASTSTRSPRSRSGRAPRRSG